MSARMGSSTEMQQLRSSEAHGELKFVAAEAARFVLLAARDDREDVSCAAPAAANEVFAPPPL